MLKLIRRLTLTQLLAILAARASGRARLSMSLQYLLSSRAIVVVVVHLTVMSGVFVGVRVIRRYLGHFQSLLCLLCFCRQPEIYLTRDASQSKDFSRERSSLMQRSPQLSSPQ